MEIKAAIFDVDGTLSDVKGQICPSTIEAIDALQAKGIKVVISTGRPALCISIIEGKINPDYIVGANGHLAVDKDKNVVYERSFSVDLQNRITEYCKKNDIGLLWKYRDGLYCYNDNDMTKRTKFDQKYLRYGLHEPSILANGAGLMATEDKYPDFIKTFQEEVDVVDGGFVLHDVSIKGVNKSNGLNAVFALAGIDAKDTMAFGDSKNDMEMLQLCGTAVAMGNGVDELKAIADYVTDRCDNDGIYKALKYFEII